MSDKMKMKIMGKMVSFYIRPETGTINFYFSYEGRKIKGSTGVKSFDEIDVGDMTLKMARVIDGRSIRKVKPKVITFKNTFDEFMEYKINQGLKETTLKAYQQQGKFLVKYFGSKDIKEIGTNAMYYKYNKWKSSYFDGNGDITYVRGNKIIKSHRTIDAGVAMIDKEIFLLKRVLNWAQKFGKLPRTIQIEDWEPNKREQDETKILSKDDYIKIVSYMKVDNPYYGLCVRFLNNTGVRYPSELIGIKWGDIDFRRRTISITGRKRGNKRTRVDTLIPMTDRVRDILLTLKDRPGITSDDGDYVFVNNKGERVVSFHKYWKGVLKHLGIDTDYTIYSLRHLFATRLIKRPDISIKLISEMLGHADTTMVQRVYGRFIDIDSKIATILKSEDEREMALRRLNEGDK